MGHRVSILWWSPSHFGNLIAGWLITNFYCRTCAQTVWGRDGKWLHLNRRFALKRRDNSGDGEDAHRKPKAGPQAAGPIGPRTA
jgi:hypothetical protein